MASLHIHRSMDKAARMGAYAGNPGARQLWELSKRELVEITLRLAELLNGEGDVPGAIQRVTEEAEVLRLNGII